jgi:hypothetical protein
MKRFALPLLAVLLLGGCSAASPGQTPVPAVTVTTTVTATPSPSPTPTPEPAAPTLGVGVPHSNGWTVTLHSIDLNSAANGPQPQTASDKWVSIDVENCNGTTPNALLTSSPWRLIATDNRQFESSSTGYVTFPEPQLTFGETAIAPGECIRGWFTFVVARDATITSVKYSPNGGSAIIWPVS